MSTDVKEINQNTEIIREKVLALIESEFESDAAFEREMELKEKTVNNWRRGRSASFMKMLPRLADRFGITIGDLLNVPITGSVAELSEDEIALFTLYRKSRHMPQKLRTAMHETIKNVINMYIQSHNEIKSKRTREK